MMAPINKTSRREEAGEYWATHDVTAENSSEVSEDIHVRKPLSAMLSLRLSDEDLSKLKLIATAQGVGVTTMARMLLHQCLENPGSQLVLQALRSDLVKAGLAEILDDAKVPPGEGVTEFLVLSKAHLEQIHQMVVQTTLRLLDEGLREQSVSITPSKGELFDRLRELSPTS